MTGNMWLELEKNKTLVNVRKLDFVKNLAKPVPITPQEPLKQYFEDTESALSEIDKQWKEAKSISKESFSDQLDAEELQNAVYDQSRDEEAFEKSIETEKGLKSKSSAVSMDTQEILCCLDDTQN